MEFGTRGSVHLALTIVGYQFPAMATEPYDSNWLNVRLSASGPLGSWHAVDPALLTYEALDLAAWLTSLGEGSAPSREWGAMEPNIGFEWEPGGARGILRVRFAAEFLPPSFPREMPDPEGAFLDFTMSAADLLAAAESLRADLVRFPQRAPV